ncbi:MULTISPECIES: hypothetical protein [Myroides]|uniref:Beta-carotene 15,15'-monooxygenase n=1 Tax=Myroides albus TaxID=2562892 RepID=A0A6I3LHA0_9FLAO|nr:MULTISPECIES: hypothetical protein [Myroides]MTG97174.1 hypothetical protein [Myroides albus]MVX35171.1 hypothetical protein [Myroides sp. LoEW2-1]UVD78916.1 hypothetical protein NWE55_12400 [Myroides albus]
MNNLNDILKNIKENGYQIAPFQVMGEAFTYYKRTFLSVIATLMFIIFGTMLLISSIISNNYDLNKEDQSVMQEQLAEIMNNFLNLLITTPYIYYYYVAMIFLTAIGSIVMAGFFKLNADASHGRLPRFLGAFKYFLSIKGLYVFIAALIVTTVFMAISVPFQLMGLSMVALAINWLVHTLTIFTIPLIIFGNRNPLAAIKDSIMVVNKQPIPIILTIVLNYFLLMSSLFIFLIGIFLFLPYLFSVYFTLYKQVIGYYPEEGQPKH